MRLATVWLVRGSSLGRDNRISVFHTRPDRTWGSPSLLYEGRLRLKCDGTRAETRIRLSPKRTSPFKSAGASVQSTTGSRGVRISVSNAGYTMFRGSVKSTGYPLHSPVSPSLPPPLRYRVPLLFNWTLTELFHGVKGWGLCVDQPSPYSAQFRNEYSYTSTCCLCLI